MSDLKYYLFFFPLLYWSKNVEKKKKKKSYIQDQPQPYIFFPLLVL